MEEEDLIIHESLFKPLNVVDNAVDLTEDDIFELDPVNIAYNEAVTPKEEDVIKANNTASASKLERFQEYDNQEYLSEADMQITIGEDYEDYLHWKQTGEVRVNPDDISSEVANLTYLRGEEYLDNLPDADRKAYLEKLPYSDLTPEEREEVFKTESNAIMRHIEDMDSRFQDMYQGLYTERAALEAAGEDTSEIDEKIFLLNRRKRDDYNDAFNRLGELGDVQTALDLFSRSYQASDQLTTAFERIGIDLTQIGLDFVRAIDTAGDTAFKGLYSLLGIDIGDDTENVNQPKLQEMQDSLADAAIENQRYSAYFLERPQTFDTAFDSLDNFFEWAGETVINQSPYLLMAFTGPAAVPLFFASGAGAKSTEFAIKDRKFSDKYIANLEEQVDTLEWGTPEYQEAARKLFEVQQHRATSKGARAASILSYGAAEAIFERFGTLEILKQIKGVARAAKEGGKTALHKAIKKRFGTFALPKAFVTEAASEGATTIAQNWADVVFLDEDKSLLEGVDEAAAAGGLIGLLLGGGGVIHNKIINATMPQRLSIAARKLENQYINAKQELVKNETSGHLSPGEVKVLEDIVADVEDVTSTFQGVTIEAIKAVPPQTRHEIFKLDQRARQLQRELGIIDNKDSKLPDEVRDIARLQTQTALDQIKEETSALIEQKLSPKEHKILGGLSKASHEDVIRLSEKLESRKSYLTNAQKVVQDQLGKQKSPSEILRQEDAFYEESLGVVENAIAKVDKEIEVRQEAEVKAQEAAQAKQEAKKEATESVRAKLQKEAQPTETQEVTEEKPKKKSLLKKVVDKVTGVEAVEKEEAKAKEKQKEKVKKEEAQAKVRESLGIKKTFKRKDAPTKDKTKSEKSKSETFAKYIPVRKGKTPKQVEVEKAEKIHARKTKTGEATPEEIKQIEQQREVAEKEAKSNIKNNAIAEAVVDIHNDYKNDYKNAPEVAKVIGENTDTDNVDDVIDSVLDNTTYDAPRLLLFMNISKAVKENQSLSAAEKKEILKKLSKVNIDAIEVAKLEQLRKDILNDPDHPNKVSDYLTVTAHLQFKNNYKEVAEKSIETINKVKVQKITPDAKLLKDLKKASEADIAAFKAELVEAIGEAQKTFFKETRGGSFGAKNLLPLIDKTVIAEMLVESVLKNVQSLAGVNAELNIAKAVQEYILEDSDIKQKAQELVDKHNAKPTTKEERKLSDLLPTPPKRQSDKARVDTNDAGREYIVEPESPEYIAWKKDMIKLGKEVMNAVTGLDGLLIKDYGFSRFMNNGTISVSEGKDSQWKDIQKALNKVGKSIVSFKETPSHVFNKEGLYQINIKKEKEFNDKFSVDIGGTTYKGLDGLNKLIFTDKGGAQHKGQPMTLFNDYGATSPNTYKVRDLAKLKSVILGSQIESGKKQFHDTPVTYTSDKAINGTRPMANKNPNAKPTDKLGLSATNRYNHTKLSLSADAVDYFTKRYLDGDTAYTFVDKGYEEDVARVLEEGFQAGIINANDRKGTDFFIQHFMDWRTRIYSANSVLNYQGIKSFLAMYELAKAKTIGENGLQAIYIQAADQFNAGTAKGLMFERDRLQWTMDNIDHIIKFAADPDNYKLPGESKTMWDMASDKEQFFTTAREILKMTQWHKANPDSDLTEYESKIIIWQDATVSGGQHLSLLSRDRYTAALVNLLNSNQRRDLYIKVAERVFNSYTDADGKFHEGIAEFAGEYTKQDKELFNEQKEFVDEFFSIYKTEWKDKDKEAIKEDFEKYVKNDTDFERAAKIFWGQQSKRELMRTLAKGPVMTSFYNAGAWAMMENLLANIKTKEQFAELQDKGEYGYTQHTTEDGNVVDNVDGFRRAMVLWLTQKMYDATRDIAVGPSSTKTFLTKLVKAVATQTTDDGKSAPFLATGIINNVEIYSKYMRPYWGPTAKSDVRVRNRNKNSLRHGEWNTSSFVTEWYRDYIQEGTAIAPNITHFLDAQLVHWEALYGGRDSLVIHDNFGTHASDAKQQTADLRAAMAYMYEGAPELVEHGGDLMNKIIHDSTHWLNPELTKDWQGKWKEVREKVKNRKITPEMREILGPEGNNNWNVQENLEQNNWAINGAAGTNIMHNPIDKLDEQFFELLNNSDLKNSIKWNNGIVKDDANEAINPCKVK